MKAKQKKIQVNKKPKTKKFTRKITKNYNFEVVKYIKKNYDFKVVK